MNKVLHFDLDTSFVKIKEIMKNKDFIELEFWAISDEYPNNNKSHFPFNTFQYNIDRNVFYNKPILGKFNNLTNNYESHVYKKKYDPEFDMEYYDYEDGERPLGLIRESDRVRIETDSDGLHWIVFTAVLWVKYNYQGVKRILKSKKGKVSVEVTVTKYHEDENGIEIFDEWMFDGITILGYRPNTTIPVKEGINNARLTINDLMNEKTFSNQLKTLCFAYEELDNNDIKENQSHLYKEENNKGTEGCIMSYADKRNALESILSMFVEENNEDVSLHVYDFDENIVFFHFSDADYKSEYSIDDDGNITVDFENKIIVDKSFADKSKEKEEPSDDGKECKMNDEGTDDGEEGQDCPKEDDQCGKVGCSEDNSESDDKSGDEDSEKKDESEEKSEEEANDTNDDHEDSDENKDDCKDGCKDDSCNRFSLNDELFTGEELVNKYIVDMEEKDNAYDSLQKQYSEILSQKEILEEKVKKYEEQEAKEKMEAFCSEVSKIAIKEGFNEEEVKLLVERCKNGEFAEIKDAIKEIAYIVFTNKKENEDQHEENVEKPNEFSAKIIEPKKEQVNKTKSSFDSLKEYVNK